MKNMQKNYGKIKKTKKQKVQTHGQGLGRGLAGHGSELFVFFGFSMVFCSLAKTSRKPKKQKKTKSSDPWARSGERPGWGHGSELFFCFFLVFPWFFAVWPKPRENQKKKVQTHGQGLGRGLAGDMGLNFCFFLVFSIVFCSLAKTSRKPKKTKSSDPWARSGERPGRGHGSDFFSMFFFACFSCGDAFITVPLKKCAFLQFAHLHPP